MYALAGNGTWLAYLFGGTMLTFVALCINQFARRSASAGSMYHYVAEHLGRAAGAIARLGAALGLRFRRRRRARRHGALRRACSSARRSWSPFLVVAAIALVAWQAAYRGVQVSAIVMLVLEVVSVTIICIGRRNRPARRTGLRSTLRQVRIEGGFPGGIGLAIALAVFSFVGFESATAFGGEAKRPLVTIPRAVIGSVVFVAAFFVIATYAEIVGFAHAGKPLGAQTFPIGTLAQLYGVGYLRVPMTIGALCSAFSVCLACITTAGRVAYAMACGRLLPAGLRAHRAAARHAERRGDARNRAHARRRAGRVGRCAWRRSTSSTTAERSARLDSF